MRQYVWCLWRLAWMRRDCIPFGGKIDGWTRLVGRLFWRTGYPLALQLRWAYRQGWIDGNGRPRIGDFDRIAQVSDEFASHYLESIGIDDGGDHE